MHQHQHETLVAELKGDEWRGMNAEAAFDLIATPNSPRASDHLKRLCRTQYEPTEELKAAFPTGVPGFPNKISREDFDKAWSEARA